MTNSAMPATVKDAAAAIRKDLRAAFPGTKFSVRMGTGINSAYIDVTWTDGPNDDMVCDITDRYVEGPVERVYWERHFSSQTRAAAQELIRTVLPGFKVYEADGRLAPNGPDTVEVFRLGGWRFGGGSVGDAVRQVADLLILNPRTGPVA